jgi:peroxiredoxin
MRSFLILAAALVACSTSPDAARSSSLVPGAATPDAAKREVRADAPLQAGAQVGQPAPDFTLTDLDGNTHTLAALKGKTVVLEWFNPGCPYVVAAYEGGPMKALIRDAQERGVVWLTINSGAHGKQGHGVENNKAAAAKWELSQPVLLDESGTVGRAYGAKVTPHMYVIDPAGTLVYAGALDNAPRNEVPQAGHVAFARDAVEATLAGEPVKASKTQAWGCSVKYGS